MTGTKVRHAQRRHSPRAHRDLIASQLEEIQRLTKIVNNLKFLAEADAEQARLQVERPRFDVLVHDAAAGIEKTNLALQFLSFELLDTSRTIAWRKTRIVVQPRKLAPLLIQ